MKELVFTRSLTYGNFCDDGTTDHCGGETGDRFTKSRADERS